MTNNILEGIYDEHQRLLETIEESVTDTIVPDVRQFLQQISKAGASLPNPRERSQLRALMRFWGSYIYDRIGEFPNVELLPATVKPEHQTTGPSETDIQLAALEELRSRVIEIPEPQAIESASKGTMVSEAEESGYSSASSSQGPQPGSRFGAYEILDEIGEGGFSEVYKALDTSSDQLVALKILLGDEQFEMPERFRQQLFEREKLIQELDHPHVIPVYAVGEEASIPFIVMKYVESGSLSDRLSDWFWRPSIRDVLAITCQVADGLEYLHNKEIVHRDIKPANILLGFDDHVYLTDFGIAQVIESAFRGMIVGTPEYLAPEAILHPERVDGRADLYSLGVILFELLTGRVPFSSDSPEKTMYQQVNREVPDLPEEVPESLAKLVHKCMAKSPAERYEDASELKRETEKLLNSLPGEILESQTAQFVAPPEVRPRSHQTTRIPVQPARPTSPPPPSPQATSPQPPPLPSVPSSPNVCPNCGSVQPQGAVFCDDCGASIPEPPADERSFGSTARLRTREADTKIVEGGSRSTEEVILAILIAKSETALGDYYVVERNRAAIGRGQHNDVVIDELSVSRQHALLVYDKPDEKPGVFTIYDLASANGVHVNGSPVIKHRLKHNDVIKLGRVKLEFKRLDR